MLVITLLHDVTILVMRMSVHDSTMSTSRLITPAIMWSVPPCCLLLPLRSAPAIEIHYSLLFGEDTQIEICSKINRGPIH